jgi:hypothetical protein
LLLLLPVCMLQGSVSQQLEALCDDMPAWQPALFEKYMAATARERQLRLKVSSFQQQLALKDQQLAAKEQQLACSEDEVTRLQQQLAVAQAGLKL